MGVCCIERKRYQIIIKSMKRENFLSFNKGEKAAASFDKRATETIHKLSGALYRLTESKEHKQLREATGIINHYVSWYLKQEYDSMEPINPVCDLQNDNNLRKALSVKGISEKEWIEDSEALLNIAPILALKKDGFYKNTPEENERYYDGRFQKRLRNALAFFNISKEEWIRYGIKVLTIYDIYEEEDRVIIKLNGKDFL